MPLADLGLEEFGQPAGGVQDRLGGPGRVLEHLLDVDFHLAQDRGRDGVAIAFIGQNGHSVLEAERLEDGLRDPEGQAVERPDDDDAVVASAFGLEPLAHRRNDFAEDRGGHMFGRRREQGRHMVWAGDQQTGLPKQPTVVFLELALGLIGEPVLQILLPVRLKDPRAGFGQRPAAGLQAPMAGGFRYRIISPIEQQIV
jgi:hypothetical protein